MAASMRQVISRFSRFTVSSYGIHTSTGPLLFRATPIACGEPLKKKKRIDPALVMEREKKKKRKIEKQIRRLERLGRKLKPVEELTRDYKLNRETELRHRPVPVLEFEEAERRALLKKQWSAYKASQCREEAVKLRIAEQCITEALTELRDESETLYQAAIQVDAGLIPFERTGPVRTAPIPDYDTPDGDYTDTTKQF